VNEFESHLAAFETDLANRPFDPAADFGTVIRQAAPQD
jgi:hypothetical protein